MFSFKALGKFKHLATFSGSYIYLQSISLSLDLDLCNREFGTIYCLKNNRYHIPVGRSLPIISLKVVKGHLHTVLEGIQQVYFVGLASYKFRALSKTWHWALRTLFDFRSYLIITAYSTSSYVKSVFLCEDFGFHSCIAIFVWFTAE